MIWFVFAATTYALLVFAGIASYCFWGVFKCAIGDNLSFDDVFIPMLIVSVPLFLAGLFVVFIVKQIINYYSLKSIAMVLVIGGIAGFLPRLIVFLIGVGSLTGMHPHSEYLIYFFAGASAALLYFVSILRQEKKSSPS